MYMLQILDSVIVCVVILFPFKYLIDFNCLKQNDLSNALDVAV